MRWLLWNVRCWRGWRCADVRVDGTNLGADVNPAIVAGTSVKLSFRCGGCGTRYERNALITGPGQDVVHLDRMRVG